MDPTYLTPEHLWCFCRTATAGLLKERGDTPWACQTSVGQLPGSWMALSVDNHPPITHADMHSAATKDWVACTLFSCTITVVTNTEANPLQSALTSCTGPMFAGQLVPHSPGMHYWAALEVLPWSTVVGVFSDAHVFSGGTFAQRVGAPPPPLLFPGHWHRCAMCLLSTVKALYLTWCMWDMSYVNNVTSPWPKIAPGPHPHPIPLYFSTSLEHPILLHDWAVFFLKWANGTHTAH